MKLSPPLAVLSLLAVAFAWMAWEYEPKPVLPKQGLLFDLEAWGCDPDGRVHVYCAKGCLLNIPVAGCIPNSAPVSEPAKD